MSKQIVKKKIGNLWSAFTSLGMWKQVEWLRTAPFCIITQQIAVISYRRFGTTCHFELFNSENGTENLSRNVGKNLPLFAALNQRRAVLTYFAAED
jgi:hypothetical protein